jgi:hypothetical protein
MINESSLEQTTLAWFENLGYNIEHGPDIVFDGSRSEHMMLSKLYGCYSHRSFAGSTGKD